MTYALVKNGKILEYPLYEGDIKLRFPGTSFSTPFQPPFDYVPVTLKPHPTLSYDKNLREGIPEFIDDELTQVWIVENASEEEIQQRTETAKSQARLMRNERLSSCDWTQLPDAPVDAAAWAIYRQELRDITGQTGFPWDIAWPEQP